MELTLEEPQQLRHEPPKAVLQARSMMPKLARKAVPNSPHSTLSEPQGKTESDEKPGINFSLRHSSFVSWYGILDAFDLATSAAVSECDSPSLPHNRSDALSWCTATGSSALSSDSVSVASVRPYYASNYALPDDDEAARVSAHFEAFDGGPYLTQQEAELRKLRAEVKRLQDSHGSDGMDSKRTLRSKKSQVLERPWTSMSRIEDEDPQCRYERRMRCRADVEEEYWKLVMGSYDDGMQDEEDHECQ